MPRLKHDVGGFFSSGFLLLSLAGADKDFTSPQIFDAISYSKGASVLKQLANQIGEETFLRGV
jgi:hypothetical protein